MRSSWKTTLIFFADWNLSSTELESGNAIGAFLQTPAPALDKISGPMGAWFLSSTGLGSGNLIERAHFPPEPALDKNQSPSFREILVSPNLFKITRNHCQATIVVIIFYGEVHLICRRSGLSTNQNCWQFFADFCRCLFCEPADPYRAPKWEIWKMPSLGPRNGLSGGPSWSHLNDPPGIFNSLSP